MTPEQIAAADARQLLDNPLFKQAFSAVAEYLEQSALGCDPDNAAKAQRIVIAKQLLQAVKREIERKIDDGDMAEIEIAELERKKGLLRFLR